MPNSHHAVHQGRKPQAHRPRYAPLKASRILRVEVSFCNNLLSKLPLDQPISNSSVSRRGLGPHSNSPHSRELHWPNLPTLSVRSRSVFWGLAPSIAALENTIFEKPVPRVQALITIRDQNFKSCAYRNDRPATHRFSNSQKRRGDPNG